MNGETNENLDGLNLDNAFSDLISEYFTDENNTINANNINEGPVLDWDSVANGQLYQNNAETIIKNDNTEKKAYGIKLDDVGVNVPNNNLNNNGLYVNLQSLNENNNNIELEEESNPILEQANNENKLYDKHGKLNTKALVKNAYEVMTINGNLLKGINNNIQNNENNGIVNLANTNNTKVTEFKLTQGNLPAKIGFWTKVRNFFISDSKIGYSVQQSAQENTGVWNRLQNFFSFGKNK